MVYALRLTRPQLSLSLLLYFNERSAVKGRAWHAWRAIQIQMTGTSKALRLSGPLPTLPLGLVFFRLVFTCGLFSFLPRVSMTLGYCNASFEQEQKKQTQGARKSSRLQLCRPKFIVKFPKC